MPINDKYGDDDIAFAGHTIEVECEALGGDIIGAMKNFIAKNEIGSAEVGVVLAAVKTLKIDGDVHNVRANKKFPQYWDDERQQTLLEFLCAYVVDHERWLAAKFPAVFGQYLGTTDQKNPTKSPKGPSKGN